MAQSTYLTIGNFDGVHRGHQVLIESMLASAHAAGSQGGVLTFDPHPLAVVRPDIALRYLTDIDERCELLAAHGVDFVVILPFTRATAATPATQFMADLSVSLNLRSLWIGPDFALGRGREGTPERLAEIGRELDYAVHPIRPYEEMGGPVHSSRIRGLIMQDGAVAEAAELLGRPYQIWGVVERGAQRGRQLGYPTANLAVPEQRLVPAFGIYACWAWRGDRGYPAAVSVGVRPTFDHGLPSVEAFLLDFDGDLYGETMGLSFIARLRPEQKFPDPQALIAQMGRDVDTARAILTGTGTPSGAQRGKEPEEQKGGGEVVWRGSPTGALLEGEESNLPVSASPRPHVFSAAWEELPHTADWSVRVRGITQRELFTQAAHAMYALQDADAARPVTVARAVDAQAADPTELLVAWLNRLLLEQESHGEMYTRFDLYDLSARGLRGVAYGYAGQPSHTAVKAVTFWNLDVSVTDAGWTATLTFDV